MAELSQGEPPKTHLPTPAEDVPANEPDILINLPRVLAAEFTVVRELGSGAQGWLVLCSRNSAPTTQVVVKLYQAKVRNGAEDPRAQFKDLSADYVAAYVEPFYGQTADRWWEVTEYLPEGNIREVAEREGGKLTPAQIRATIERLSEALHYLHGRKPSAIIHRDIKPDNILVRSLEPFRPVLADFGLAVLTDMRRDRRSDSRTVAYAAPEAAGGEVSGPRDWWSLGMSIAELATGRHPYQLADGMWLTDAQILSEVSTRPVPLEGITDARLLMLLRGLLTRAPEDRWAYDEVHEWLGGGSPGVVEERKPVASTHSAASAPSVPPFPFNDHNHTHPDELAAAMGANWGKAAALVLGADLPELASWVRANYPNLSIDSIVSAHKNNQLTVDRTIAAITVRLSPSGPAIFMGEAVDSDALPNLAARLGSDGTLIETIDRLFTSRSLIEYAKLSGQDVLGLVERKWDELCGQADEWFRRVPEAGTMDGTTRALILRVATMQFRDKVDLSA